MTNPVMREGDAPSILPDNFIQSGSNIDIEIALRLSRSIWKAVALADVEVRGRLNGFLQEEIDGLVLQHEIDRSDSDSKGLAIAQILGQYKLPTA